MPGTLPDIHTLDWRLSPADVLARWPSDRQLVALISSDPASRWSIFAHPDRTIRIHENDDPLTRLHHAIEFPLLGTDSPLPFLGGWLVTLSYDLGRVLEPAAQHHAVDANRPPRSVSLIELHRCNSALIHDARSARWHAVGAPPALSPAPSATPRFAAAVPTSRTGRDHYRAAVARCVQLIHDGHIFQANLAHHLAGPYEGSPRVFMQRLLAAAAPGYAAYLESNDHTICSISPELFLDADFAQRRVTTRPIKGTRPAHVSADRDLEHSEKDRAELAMIVDLMRNDLGRICEYGSVNVDDPRTISLVGGVGASPATAGALYHASSTISGTLRHNVTLADLLRATFPPGSVTGAPKVRAMQIIDELEPHARGVYCGAIGFISDHGRSAFNVAIRTATLDHATSTLTFPVGAGIVADSDPDSEWNETMHKAEMFLRALNPSPSPAASRPPRSTKQDMASEAAR